MPVLWFSTECPGTATIAICCKSDSAIVLHNICLKNSPIAGIAEILIVQFKTSSVCV